MVRTKKGNTENRKKELRCGDLGLSNTASTLFPSLLGHRGVKEEVEVLGTTNEGEEELDEDEDEHGF